MNNKQKDIKSKLESIITYEIFPRMLEYIKDLGIDYYDFCEKERIRALRIYSDGRLFGFNTNKKEEYLGDIAEYIARGEIINFNTKDLRSYFIMYLKEVAILKYMIEEMKNIIKQSESINQDVVFRNLMTEKLV